MGADWTVIGMAVAAGAGLFLALRFGRALLRTVQSAAIVGGALLFLVVILLLALSTFQANTAATIAVAGQGLGLLVIGVLAFLLVGACAFIAYLLFRLRAPRGPDRGDLPMHSGDVVLQLLKLLAANQALLMQIVLQDRRRRPVEEVLPYACDETALSYEYVDDGDAEVPTLPQGWGW